MADINRHQLNNRVVPVDMIWILIGYDYWQIGKDEFIGLLMKIEN